MSTTPNERNRAGGRGFETTQTNVGGLQTQCTDARVEVLLARLDGVQKSGKGWRSFCPSCGGRSRKLAISEGNGGTLLVHCFSCNDTAAILSAVGLSVSDLFPAPIRDQSPDGRRAAQQAFKQTAWAAALGVLAREATVVEIAAHDLADSKPLSDTDHARLLLACERVEQAREVLQ